MAQSKGFFGLRKGSTKSLTFSTLDGKQITKDCVYDVKNPRTESQMRQRMLMTTVGAAYKMLKYITVLILVERYATLSSSSLFEAVEVARIELTHTLHTTRIALK